MSRTFTPAHSLHDVAAPVDALASRTRPSSEGGPRRIDRGGRCGARVPRAALGAGAAGPGPRAARSARKGISRMSWCALLVGWRAAGARCRRRLPLVVEIVHAGSLVIDDVEDDSAERRGRPCLHRLYGVPIAINVGNWLYFWALELVGRAGSARADARRAAARADARAMFRCHFGQALDLSRARRPDPAARDPGAVVAAATELKTGALMELAARVGAIGGARGHRAASRRWRASAAAWARRCRCSTTSATSRRAPADGAGDDKRHEDLRLGRPTWPWAWAAETLDERRSRRCRPTRASCARRRWRAPPATEALAQRRCAAPWRRTARRAGARAPGARAWASWRKASGLPSPSSRLVVDEIARLEASYG